MTGCVQKRPVVYLDACFVSRLTGWVSSVENRVKREQLATREAWRRMEGKVMAVVSSLVWNEIGRGDAKCAAQRVAAIDGLPTWRFSEAALALAAELLQAGAVRKEKPDDAMHIALAAVGGADVLLSWNFQDIVNEKKMSKIKAIVERAGHRCPLITSPDKLPEEWP